MFDIILRGGTVVTPQGVAIQDVVLKGELIAVSYTHLTLPTKA